ncbi:MAG: hypothetical protein BAJALOKI2v1_50032 [Promethearchaeota archaeon]|nr:MAG: hypothetical protein BAJALOKI2v1_50032 [Candidatus Lokiarchaeota archaeon]
MLGKDSGSVPKGKKTISIMPVSIIMSPYNNFFRNQLKIKRYLTV